MKANIKQYFQSIRTNKFDSILLNIISITIGLYLVAGLGMLLVKLYGIILHDNSNIGMIMVLPVILAIWLLTPVACVAVALLAVRTKKLLFIISTILMAIAIYLIISLKLY